MKGSNLWYHINIPVNINKPNTIKIIRSVNIANISMFIIVIFTIL